MALVGIASGVILVAAPQVSDFWIKPYFWVLLAVAVFDGAIFLRAGNVAVLPMDARVIGFIVGAVLMMIIPNLAGSPAKFF